MTNQKNGQTPAKMVGWFDPQQLLLTGVDVLVSTLFGRHSDPRLREALATGRVEPHDYTIDAKGKKRKELWLDYLADTGDGWDPTYTVAYYVAQPRLELKTRTGKEYATRRGDILVFGGDEVYPAPSREGYQQKLVFPYETALPFTSPPHPHLFAVPGNHDWYDSLVAFTRQFCSGRWFGGWQTRQERSYFALNLPHGWWLLGTDVQLGSDIDKPQVDYFKQVAKKMKKDDRVILCNAEPYWIYARIYGKYDSKIYSESNLQFLEEKVLGRKISVFISGDLHHYRRHDNVDGIQKITAGGGGAFLHATHVPDVSSLEGGFRLRTSFPDARTSRNLTWRNLLFLLINPWFGVITGLLYLLNAWAVMADIGKLGIGQIGDAIETTVRSALASPASAFWALALWAGFLLFTDTHSRVYRWVMGTAHAFTHLFVTFLLGWLATSWCVSTLDWEFKSVAHLLLSGFVVFAGGWILGSFILGIYLLISVDVFGRHANEAFSSLLIKDWKNFLRMRIDVDGNLTIYPVGIRKVARKWKGSDGNDASSSRRIPDDSRHTVPELIEDPIVLGRQHRVRRKPK